MITFGEAYSWLNRSEISPSYLRRPIKLSLMQANEAMQAGDYASVCKILEGLVQSSRRLNRGMRPAETLLECGRVYYALNNPYEAEKLIKEAAEKYGHHLHQAAISTWMLGCVLFDMPERSQEAAEAWRRSQQMIAELAEHSLRGSFEAAWYENLAKQMGDSIDEAARLPIRWQSGSTVSPPPQPGSA